MLSTRALFLRALRLAAPLTTEEAAKRTPRQIGPLTQEEAALRVSAERGVWNKWENDKRGLGEESARRIAEAFGGDSPAELLEELLQFVGGGGEPASLIDEVRALRAEVADLAQRVERAEATPTAQSGALSPPRAAEDG